MISAIPATAPVDAVMPALTQTILIMVFGAMIVVALIHALILLRRDNDNRLLVLLGCGATAALMEGFACSLINCHHSIPGMVEVYQAFGIHVPLWLAALYVLFYGAMPYYFLKSFARTPTPRYFWTFFALTGLSEGVGEMATIYLGTHVYHGAQPLSVFGFPLYLAFVNPAGGIGMALLAAYWFNAVQGARRYLLIALTPFVVSGVYAGMTLPTTTFIQAGNPGAAAIGSIVSIVLALTLSAFVFRSLLRFAAQYRV